MGLRKLIYIPDDGIWDSVQKTAKKENRSVSNYLINLHRDYVNFVEHENLRVAQKVVPEVEFIVPGGDFRVDSDSVTLAEEERKRIIIEAREKVDGMIAGKGYYPPRPKGQDGKK